MSEEKNPMTLKEVRDLMKKMDAEHRRIVSNRVSELIVLYGSRRKLGKALDIDHAYLHHLQKGTKQPSDKVLKRLGLI